MTLGIREFYAGKAILITGVTGYLAKIIMEKIIRSCPDFKVIYVLMRLKKGVTLVDRLKKDVLNSPVFQHLLATNPQAAEIIAKKVVPIQGDLIQDSLGLKPEIRQLLIDDLDIIINSAASVAFTNPLQEALQINYYGAVKILDLALECKHLECLSHISTAYVGINHEKHSVVEEIVSKDNSSDDWEVQIKNIMSLNREECSRLETQLTNGYPNTYTYTKNLAERHLLRYGSPKLKVVISRPSIIIHCSEEPFTGWIENLSAAAGVAFPFMMGMARSLFLPEKNILDFIPCDTVSNAIIAATAYIGKQPQPLCKVYHMTSSSSNPSIMGVYWGGAREFLKYNPTERQIREPRVLIQNSIADQKRSDFIEEQIPLALMDLIARLPVVGSVGSREQLAKFHKVRATVQTIQDDLKHFIEHWVIYDNKTLQQVFATMSPEEQKAFNFDTKTLNWASEGGKMVYGLQRFYLNQDTPKIESGYRGILQKNHIEWGHDIKFAWNARHIIQHKELSGISKDVLNPVKFQQFLSLLYPKSDAKNPQPGQLIGGLQSSQKTGAIIQLNAQDAFKQIQKLNCAVNQRAWQGLLVYINQKMRKLFEGLYVHDNGLNRVKDLLSKKQKVVLIPVYKSFVDLPVLLYCLYLNKIDFPFSFGNVDDIPNVAFLEKIITNCGYIKATRSRGQGLQQSYISQAVLREIIKKYPMCILFQNSLRLRSGKLTQPAHADLAIQWLMQAYTTSFQKEGASVTLVPVSINYERIFELRNLATEMVSGQVPRYSLTQLLAMINSEQDGRLGKIFVNFGRPINLSTYLEKINYPKINHTNIDQASFRLSEKLYKEQQQMSSANLSWIVAAVLLQETAQSISLRALTSHCGKIYKYLTLRKITAVIMMEPSQFAVEKVVKRLGFRVQKMAKQPRGASDEQEVLLDAKQDKKVMLGLSYYSNALFQPLIMDHLVGYFIVRLDVNQKVQLSQFEQNVKTMYEILRFEFIEKLKQKPLPQSIEERLHLLQEMGEITISDGVLTRTSVKKIVGRRVPQEQPFSFVQFFNRMGGYLIDTYLIVLLAAQEICLGVYEIEEDKLVDALHKQIIEMHAQSLVQQLQSCFRETINTALSRFVRLGLVTSSTYTQANGARITFITCAQSKKQAIEEQLNQLTEFKQINDEELIIWNDRVIEAIENARVVFLSMAKL